MQLGVREKKQNPAPYYHKPQGMEGMGMGEEIVFQHAHAATSITMKQNPLIEKFNL